MNFFIVDPANVSALIQDFPDIEAAQRSVGLKPGQLDFGMFGPHIGYCVYEFGLFAPQAIGYCAISKTLIAGPAVLFRVGDEGETVDWLSRDEGGSVPPVMFFGPSLARVERAIRKGLVIRPETSINGAVLWRWPQPRPE